MSHSSVFGVTMYSSETVSAVLAFVEAGWNYSAISRATGVNRSTIRGWDQGNIPVGRHASAVECPVCNGILENLPPGPYVYLLGLYLGDGYIATHKRGVYRLRISCCDSYPALMD